MAVISLDFRSTACCPSTSRWRLAHRPLADPTAEQPAPRRRRGGDQVQWIASLGPGVAASGGLAIDRDDVRPGRTQAFDPRDETGLEQLRVERVDHVVERVVRGDAMAVGLEAPQESQPLATPGLDLDEVIGPSQRGGQHQQQDLRQRVDHLPGLPRVLQGGEMVQQGCSGHARLAQSSRHPMNHTKSDCGIPFLRPSNVQAIALAERRRRLTPNRRQR